LVELQDAYGIPCVINTSLNGSGGSIVYTHKEIVAGLEMGTRTLILDILLPYRTFVLGSMSEKRRFQHQKAAKWSF
jgi:predicted NodU family carbamoyl transferase